MLRGLFLGLKQAGSVGCVLGVVYSEEGSWHGVNASPWADRDWLTQPRAPAQDWLSEVFCSQIGVL